MNADQKPSTMPALVGGAGPEWVLDEVSVPSPSAGQVLIRVHAAGMNRADLLMLARAYNPDATRPPNKFTAGAELAGEVVAIGDGVSGLVAGDRVMAASSGAFAPYALVDSRRLIPVPREMSWTDAAALPVGLTTEHDALVTQAGFKAGDSVLITGASSGVGMIGIQLAKAFGASKVITTTTSPRKASALKDAGADLVIDTTAEDVTAAVRAATDGAGVDIVLDHIGGNSFGGLLMATRVQGTIINIGRLGGHAASMNLDELAFRRLRILGTTFSIRTDEERGQVAAALGADVLPALAASRIHPIVERIVAFDRAQEGADLMRSGTTIGKIVLEMPS
jgi:NADPH2:quinone reductase